MPNFGLFRVNGDGLCAAEAERSDGRSSDAALDLCVSEKCAELKVSAARESSERKSFCEGNKKTRRSGSASAQSATSVPGKSGRLEIQPNFLNTGGK